MRGSIRGVVCGALVALLAGAAGTVGAQQDETQVVPFSDPSRPGKIEAHLLSGSITVHGENRRDVAVVMRGGEARRPGNERPAPPPGMRRLTQAPGFEITEERNEIKIEAGFRNNGANLELRVPLRTNLELGSVNGGVVTVENVEGELEIGNVNGRVVLTNVAGSVVANSTNGGVTATLSRVTGDKAMAFTSLNGNIDVTMPASIKANLKIRSDNGDVFTDFDVQLRQTNTGSPTPTRNNGKFRVEVNRALYGSVNGGGPEIELRSFNGSIFLRKGQ